MSRPPRIQLRRAKGWRMPEGAVIVDRRTPWGNPFVVGRDGTRAECVRWHRLLLHGYVLVSRGISAGMLIDHRRWVASHIHLLVGKVLACWCREDQECHADELVAYAASSEAERVAIANTSRARYARRRAIEARAA